MRLSSLNEINIRKLNLQKKHYSLYFMESLVDWKLESWRGKPVAQMPEYEDQEKHSFVLNKVRTKYNEWYL